jgi:hypothetical protein
VPSHDIDVLSLMAGVGFAGLGLVALISGGAGIAGRWTWPVLLIVVGVVGLVASRRGTKA